MEPLGSEWSSEALLWFQTRVDGEQLSACVRSVTEQGYGVELESRGQNVAAALIAEQLAKVPGEIPKETHTSTASGGEQQEGVKENDHSQIQVQASNQTGNSKEISTNELPVAAPSGQLEAASLGRNALFDHLKSLIEMVSNSFSAPSFPMDWKTTELPLNETFQPYIAAVTSPSLFYLIGPSQGQNTHSLLLCLL